MRFLNIFEMNISGHRIDLEMHSAFFTRSVFVVLIGFDDWSLHQLPSNGGTCGTYTLYRAGTINKQAVNQFSDYWDSHLVYKIPENSNTIPLKSSQS